LTDGIMMSDERSIRRVALLGNHLPRRCGIATFTTDLSEAIATAGPHLDCFVLAMNDAGHQHAYPPDGCRRRTGGRSRRSQARRERRGAFM